MVGVRLEEIHEENWQSAAAGSVLELPVSNIAVADLPALKPHFPQRPEAAKPAHQLRRQDHQVGGLWPCESVRFPDQNIYA